MSHKIFRLFLSLIIMVGLVAVERPRAVVAAGPWYVSTTGDDNNDCLSPSTPCATINGTVGKASSGDTVNVAEGTYTGLGGGVVLIDKDISLSGGWDATFTAQSGMSILDGQSTGRGLTVVTGTVFVENFLIQNGSYATTPIYGAGVLNNGNLTINNSAIARNVATHGGGIFNTGTLTINNSSVTENTAAYGGGINNSGGQVTLNNSTLSGNTVGTSGGGIYNESSGVFYVNSSTVSKNKADGGIFGSGGGIYNWSGSITVRNSIVASNSASNSFPDCNNFISLGYNLIEDASGCFFSPVTGDLIFTSALLGPLVGSPAYHPLSSASPAVNAGNPAGCSDQSGNPLVTDGRGVARDGTCDMGAYEYTTPGAAASIVAVGGTPQSTNPLAVFAIPLQAMVLDSLGSPVPGITVTFTAPGSGASGTFADSGTVTTAALTDEFGTATAASFTANAIAGGYLVTATASGLAVPANFQLSNALWLVAPGGNDANDCLSPSTPCATINGALGKAGSGQTIRAATGTYTGIGNEVVYITKDITLSGGWDSAFTTQNGKSTIDGENIRRGIYIVSFGNNVNVVIEHVIVQNGNSGIMNNGQTLTLNNSIVSNNTGSGVWSGGSLTINNSTISKNTSGEGGGGIRINDGTATISNSVIKDNTSSSYGGGIFNAGNELTLNNSAVIGNIANTGGGTNGGGGILNGGILIINNSTISGNTALNVNGGGILNAGTLFTNNTTIAHNKANTSGGLDVNFGSVNLQNTILAGNSSDSVAPDCSGFVSSSGYNIVGNTSGCTFVPSTGDLTDFDPNLGLLIIPSEFPAYHPLLAGSAAIDAGNPGGCTDGDGNILSTDQRGVARVNSCDIGAYEFTASGPAVSLAVAVADHQSGTTTLAFPEPLRAAALDSQGSPVSGVTVDFTAPPSGPAGTFTNTGTNATSAVTDQGGVATASVFTANDQQGTYTVTASAIGLGSVEFHLEQLSRPSNDNLADAEPIVVLPFNDILDSTNATREPGEQFFCGSTPLTNSVWYSFTPTTTVTLRADMFGSSFSETALTLYQSFGPGFGNLGFIDRACGTSAVTFIAQAGSTYYLQAANIGSAGGELHLHVEALVAPPNDDFENADEISSLPASLRVDISAATIQPNERQICTFMNKTVWYVLHPAETKSIHFDTNGGISANINIYRDTGNGIANLEFLGCSLFSNGITVHMQAGETYYIQAGPSFNQTGELQINVNEAPTISGRVTDETSGTAIPGNTQPFALVDLQRICGPDCFEHVASRYADGDGRFVFDSYFGSPLPAGSYQIEVSATLYQTKRFGPFELADSSLDVGDLPILPIPLIGSISGRVVDAVTSGPISTASAPGVNLYRCDPNCSFVNSASLGSDGRFHFETDYNGFRLQTGSYQVFAFANQYEWVYTEFFDVGQDEHEDVGDIPLQSNPVRFSEIQACDNIQATGGTCIFSVKITNGTAQAIHGKTWSLAHMTLPNSLLETADFQVRDAQLVNLVPGASTTFQFRLDVPANTNPEGSFICTRVFVGNGFTNPFFETLGFWDLFCIVRNGSGLAVASSQQVRSSTLTIDNATTTGTEVEPNNSCASAQDVGAITDTFVMDGMLDSSQGPDIDFFRFGATPGKPMIITHYGRPSDAGALSDPLLGFFDSNCNLLAFNDDSDGLNSRLEIVVPPDGTFIMAATSYPDFSFIGGGQGSYQLTVMPVPSVSSISGTVTDALNGQPLRGDAVPYAYVELERCEQLSCFVVNSTFAGSDGTFHFETDSGGGILPVGEYRVSAGADQYVSGQTEPVAVGDHEDFNFGNIALESNPIRFSDVLPCSIPTEGGICEFSVRVTNGSATKFTGGAWSIVEGDGLGTFVNFTDFQADTMQTVNINSGRSTVLRFRFLVRGSVDDGAVICATAYAGRNPGPYFNVIGKHFLFCFVKGANGFTLMSPQATQAHMRQPSMPEAVQSQIPIRPKD